MLSVFRLGSGEMGRWMRFGFEALVTVVTAGIRAWKNFGRQRQSLNFGSRCLCLVSRRRRACWTAQILQRHAWTVLTRSRVRSVLVRQRITPEEAGWTLQKWLVSSHVPALMDLDQQRAICKKDSSKQSAFQVTQYASNTQETLKIIVSTRSYCYGKTVTLHVLASHPLTATRNSSLVAHYVHLQTTPHIRKSCA